MPKCANEDRFLLIVDDGEDDYEIMQMALQGAGFDLSQHHRCKDGRQAMDYLQRRDAYAESGAAPRPSLIFLDLNMHGLDGRETLRAIKRDRELKHIPVVVMTNSDSPEDVEIAYQEGANSYIRKAMDWRSFSKVIDTTIAFWTRVALVPVAACREEVA